MNTKKLTDKLSVSSQCMPEDVGEVVAAGFTAIINNRPDGEQVGQPSSLNMLTACSRNGLAYAFVPVVGGQIALQDVQDFKDALDRASGPVLAFCRTGTRSTTLWALSELAHQSVGAIIKTAADAGYDIAPMRPFLEQQKASIVNYP